jgi:AmmeMemoRadiSam system protein B
MKTREPIVAGKFYPDDKKNIIALLRSIYLKEKSKINTGLSKKKIIGGVVPHAGYVFSAYEAIHFFDIIKNSDSKFDTVFIINPNHTGYGNGEMALDNNECWETPLGKTEIDKDFSEILDLPVSGLAHRYEHSGEVMLPLLQYYLNYEFKILPVTISNQNYENAKKLAKSIYNANKTLNKKILIIASSDFSHYVEPELGKHLDSFVLKEIQNLNSEEIYNVVLEKNLSVCGYGPIMTLIEYSKMVSDNTRTEILRMGNSGETLPSKEVVDYVSILFYE